MTTFIIHRGHEDIVRRFSGNTNWTDIDVLMTSFERPRDVLKTFQ